MVREIRKGPPHNGTFMKAVSHVNESSSMLEKITNLGYKYGWIYKSRELKLKPRFGCFEDD